MMVHLCGPPQAPKRCLVFFGLLVSSTGQETPKDVWYFTPEMFVAFLPNLNPSATSKPSQSRVFTTAVEQKRAQHGCESLGQDKILLARTTPFKSETSSVLKPIGFL